ncbi:unnamed protein product [Closterium sp. NIES-53]
MEVVARTSMIHAAAPHFLWPFAVRYAAHQLNLWACVSLPETLPTLQWTGEVGDASVFRVRGSCAFVCDTSADKLSARAIPCVFLGFPPDTPGWQFYHPTSRRVLPSLDVTFDKSVPFYHLFPYRSAPPPPPPLFLAPKPLPGAVPVEVAGDSGAARGAASGVVEPGGVEPGGAEPGGAESEGAGSGAAEPGGAEPEGTEPTGVEPGGVLSLGVLLRLEVLLVLRRDCLPPPEPLSLQQLREWLFRRARLPSGAARAGDSAVGDTGVGGTGGTTGTGPGGARTRGTGAAGTSGVGGTGAGGAGAGDPAELGRTEVGGTRAGGTGACGAKAGGAGARGTGDGGARAGAGDTGAVDPGAGGAGAGGVVRVLVSRLLLALLLLYCVLAIVVTDPAFESAAASALVAELLDFAATCRLDYATALVAESKSASPSSVGGECALGMDVLEDRQEDFECLVAAVPHFASMQLAPQGDPDAPDILTPRSYAKAITGPYSSQWQTAMDAKMASWKYTGTYVVAAPPSTAIIVDGMWIFRVKRPPGFPPAFKARYVARGFSQRQGVDYFQTFPPTPKMTTLRVLLHVAAQRDYELHSLDFSTAFLQGSQHEEIWLRRPPGFTGTFPKGTQLSLRRPVYGLRQVPREWHDTLRTTHAALGFTPSTTDPSLFLRTDTSLRPYYVLVYVDDLVFATADTEALTLVKLELQKRHTCTDLGEMRSYLGLQITWDRARRTTTLTQSHMVHQVLQRFGFQFSSPQPTPLSTGHSLSAPPLDEFVEPTGPYPELVGCLITSGMGLVLRGWGPVVLTGYRVTASASVPALFPGGLLARLRFSFPVQRGQLRLAYVAIRANTADIFTKALPPGDHQRFSTVLGLVPTLPHLLTLARLASLFLTSLLAFLFLTSLVTPYHPGQSTVHHHSDSVTHGAPEPSGPYPELVGCIKYLMTCTRPALAYPLSIFAHFVTPRRHRKEHWTVAQRLLRYLCSTSGMGLVLVGRGPVVLTGHSDASWADDQAIQRCCEVEIYAGAMVAQESRWLTYLLTDLGERPRSPPDLYVDNKAMMALCQEQRLEHRTNHIALSYFLARELQQRGQLRLAYVASRANTADVFTNALGSGDHQGFCTALGLVPTLPHLLVS